MLQRLREKTQGWIAGVIVGFLIISMGFWGISYYLHGGDAANSVAAKFSGGDVTQAQLDNALNRFRMQHTVVDNVDRVKSDLLQQLVTQDLLATALTKDGFFIGQDQLDSILTQIPAFQIAGQFSPSQFQMAVNQLLFSVPEFLNNLKSTMLINQLQSGVMGSAIALPNEVSNDLALLDQQRNFSYITLSKNRVATAVQVSDADVSQYYQQHQSDFMLPEKVSLQYVQLSANDMMKKINPSSVELQKYYQDNIANYTQPARWKVAHILVTDNDQQALKIYQEAKQGKDFSALARQYSQDLVSAKNGGVMPWFGAGQLDASFETATANLKVGEISAPIKTKYGYEIIKLLQVQPQTAIPYAQVSAKIRQAYILEQAQKQFEAAKDQLSNSSFEHPDSLKEAAATLGLPIQTLPSFTQQGAETGLAKLPQVIAAAFSQDVLDGNNSDLITTSPTDVIVIRVLEHQSASVMPLTSVSAQIKAFLVNNAIKQKLAALANTIIQAMKAGQTESAIAKQYGVEWHQVSATLQQKNIDPAILSAAFNIPRATAQNPSVGAVFTSAGEYAVINIHSVQNATSNFSAANRKEFANRLEDAFANSEYLEYVKYLHKQAKVKYT